MDEQIPSANDLANVANDSIGCLDKLLGTLDKWGCLPMSKWRKKNMLSRQEVMLELENQKES